MYHWRLTGFCRSVPPAGFEAAATVVCASAVQGFQGAQIRTLGRKTEQSVMRYLTGKRDLHRPDLGSLSDTLGISPARIVQ